MLTLSQLSNNQLRMVIVAWERYIAEYSNLYGRAIEVQRLCMEGVEPEKLPLVQEFIETTLASIRNAQAQRRIAKKLLRRRENGR